MTLRRSKGEFSAIFYALENLFAKFGSLNQHSMLSKMKES
jgi:hypothetical protein